jgi:hypothetical protein
VTDIRSVDCFPFRSSIAVDFDVFVITTVVDVTSTTIVVVRHLVRPSRAPK